MVSISDIPDWCWTEAVGVPTDPADARTADPAAVPVPDATALLRMQEASPIRFVGSCDVRAPVLLLLGTKDKRVPKEQGLEYYYALRAAGVKTK